MIHSEADLFLVEILCILSINAEALNGTNFLGFDHVDSVALLVDQETSFLALKDLSVLFDIPNLLVLLHLCI